MMQVKAELAKPEVANNFFCQHKLGEIPRVPFNELDAADVAQALGWVKDAKTPNLCGGYYIDPAIILNTPNPAPFREEPTSVSANNPSYFSEYGKSVLEGNVTLTQPGREVTADRVTLIRDKKTGKLTNSVLVGHVNMREYGKLIVSQDAYMNFATKVHTLNNAVYRLLSEVQTPAVTGWGRAKKIVRDSLGVLNLDKASYSTCPPENNSWHVWSKHLVLDKNSGRGTATNALFFVKNVPILYTPYLNFPIDKRRKSGFLYPTVGYSKDDGVNVALPYYFNLAPNYDFTLTPEVISKRGLLTEGLLRYLTENNSGSLDLYYIPRDKAFINFRELAPYEYKPSKELTELEKAHDGRGFVNYQNQLTVNQHWAGTLDLNYASDDYFLQDFGGFPTVVDNDQLPNQADLTYAGENWRFLSRVQVFQTLHPIALNRVLDQYQRLPQLDLGGDFPSSGFGPDYQLNMELINFQHRNNFDTGEKYPVGSRLNVEPGITWPINAASGYLVPSLQLAATNYALSNAALDKQDNVTRFLPLFSVNSGLIFERAMSFFHNPFTQTLEPRLFYLYVPYVNQDKIQNFDTFLPQIDFNQLFRSNRFSGYDRIGDANQFTYALTTRFLNDFGVEKLNAGIGQIFALQKHRVCLDKKCKNDPLVNEEFSPLVGQLQYYITDRWNTRADIAWDQNKHQMETTTFNLQYQEDPKHLANFWYNFGRDNDHRMSPGDSNNLNRFGVSLSWSVIKNWNILGDWNYNASHSHAQNYLYGIEYDTCCWAIRLVQSKVFVNVDANGKNTFNSLVYLQILLKGLGNFGTNDAGGLLTSQISGYMDQFSSGFRL
ncbi:MAG: LPS assembly protein LptD [Gammaproteobacteria bacterium]|nr:LPS assembly protein LptD [Gammaproteobacteria bacterium]